MRRIAGLLALVTLGVVLNLAHAEDKTPDGKIKLSAGSVGAGVGVQWGSGTLSYKGKEYPVSVNGLSVGGVGIQSVEATGNVYDLNSLDDFNGNYTAGGVGASVAGGAGVVAMKNQNGVSVSLTTTTRGAHLGIGGGGVEMKVKD